MTTIRAGITRLDYSPTSAGWLLLAFCGATPDEFEGARLAIKSLPSQQRMWQPGPRVWKVRASALLTLSGMWPALREALAELGLSGEYSRQRYAPPPPMSPAREVAESFALLCLTPGAPLGLIQAARRYYAKAYHPDAGGDVRQMASINNAADVAEQYARRKLAA